MAKNRRVIPGRFVRPSPGQMKTGTQVEVTFGRHETTGVIVDKTVTGRYKVKVEVDGSDEPVTTNYAKDDMAFNPRDLPEDAQQEMAAQIPVTEEAWSFLYKFYGGDLIAAWGVMHPTYRLCLAQWWVEANQTPLISGGYDLDVAAQELASTIRGEHDLWEDLSRVVLRDFRKGFPLDPSTAAIGSMVRMIDLDTELLYVHPDSPNGGLWEQGESRAVYPMVMKLSGDDWKVLNWASGIVPTPGFPPTLFQVD